MYPELTITFCNDGTLCAQTRAGETRAGETTTGSPDLSVFHEDFPRLTLEIIEDWLSSDGTHRQRDYLMLLGGHLYRALFEGKDGKIAQRYRAELEKVRSSGERLRIALSFEEKYRNYGCNPWEFLFDPEEEEFFALNESITLSRRIISQEGREAADADGGPLGVLIVAFQPRGRTTDSAKMLEDALNKLKSKADPPFLCDLVYPTRKNLSSIIAKSKVPKPHVLHVIAHGRYRRNGEAQVALVKPGGYSDWCSGMEFADLIRGMRPNPRLVFLHLYEDAKSDEGDFYDSFAGLAPQLVSSGVHAVVGMQFPIKGEDAAKFSAAFYEEVLKGSTIASAVQIARELDMSGEYDNIRSFGTPVLYTNKYDTVLLRKSNRLLPPLDTRSYKTLEQYDKEKPDPPVSQIAEQEVRAITQAEAATDLISGGISRTRDLFGGHNDASKEGTRISGGTR